MSEHTIGDGHDQNRQSKREAVNALFYAVVQAIETAPETHESPIEVPTAGASLEVVNAVIARFEGSGWSVEIKQGEHTLSVNADNIDNTSTPKPPRPPYVPPQPYTPTPPVQPIYEPGNVPPPITPAPTGPLTPPVIPPGREPSPQPPSTPKAASETD